MEIHTTPESSGTLTPHVHTHVLPPCVLSLWLLSQEDFNRFTLGSYANRLTKLELFLKPTPRCASGCNWNLFRQHPSWLSVACPALQDLTVSCFCHHLSEECFTFKVVQAFQCLERLQCSFPSDSPNFVSGSKGLQRLTACIKMSVYRFDHVEVHLCEVFSRLTCSCRRTPTRRMYLQRNHKRVRVFQLASHLRNETLPSPNLWIEDLLQFLTPLLQDAVYLTNMTLQRVYLSRDTLKCILRSLGDRLSYLSVSAHQQTCSLDEFLALLMLDAARLAPSLRTLAISMQPMRDCRVTRRHNETDTSDWDESSGWRLQRMRLAWGKFLAKEGGNARLVDSDTGLEVVWSDLLASFKGYCVYS